MKIREGFVSNSSSASFVVSAKIKRNELCSLLQENMGWSHFSPHAFLELLKEDLKSQEGYLADSQKRLEELKAEPEATRHAHWESDLGCKESWIGMETKRIDFLKEKIKEVEDYPEFERSDDKHFEFIKMVLDYHHLRLNPKNEENDVWAFSGWTSMYNCPGELPDMLKEIVFLLTFEGFKKIKCEVHSDY